MVATGAPSEGCSDRVECETETEWEDNLVCPVREDMKCGQGWLYTYVNVVCRGLVPGLYELFPSMRLLDSSN